MTAKTIAEGVGQVKKTFLSGLGGLIFVFEENHASRAGQVQIATMLLRLHDRFGVTIIGLEGAIQSANPIKASWFHSTSNATPTELNDRQDVAVQMLSEGQISSAEFMTMVFNDVKVYGLELQLEYSQTGKGGDAELRYLLDIATSLVKEENVAHIKSLLKQKKPMEVIQYLLGLDPWVKEQYQSIRNTSDLSIEQEIARAEAIKRKADEVGAKIPSELAGEMDQLIEFYKTASRRSATMVNRVVSLPGFDSKTPLAMIIGAGHTSRVTNALEEKKVNYVVLRPMADSTDIQMKDFEDKEGGKWIAGGRWGLGRILNGKRKPPPTIEKPSAASYASANLVAHKLALAAASGNVKNPNVLLALRDLPGVKLDEPSVEAVAGTRDVIFAIAIKDSQGDWKKIWGRAGQNRDELKAATPTANLASLESKLLAESARLMQQRLGGGGRKGSGRKGSLDGARAGLDTLVIFSENKKDVMQHSKLSS